MRIGLVVPAYRLSGADIESLLRPLCGLISSVVVVQNDEPGVPELIFETPPEMGIVRLRCPGPIGKAAAVMMGTRRLLRATRLTHIAQADGTQKQPIRELEVLVRRMAREGSGMILGNRYGHAEAMKHGLHREALTTLWARLVRIATSYQVIDACCGMRIYDRTAAAAFISEIRCFGYGLEVAQLVVAGRHRFSVVAESVRSNQQAGNTAAEKLEENLYVLLTEAGEQFTESQRLVLCRILAAIKQRRSVTVDATTFDLRGRFGFEFVGKDDDGEDAYSLTAFQGCPQ